MAKSITPEIRARVLELGRQGCTREAIQMRMGLCRRSVGKVFQEARKEEVHAIRHERK